MSADIRVNGASRSIEEPCTVTALLDDLGLATTPCAVEVNREVVPKSRHTAHALADGDVVEIVTLVGGG